MSDQTATVDPDLKHAYAQPLVLLAAKHNWPAARAAVVESLQSTVRFLVRQWSQTGYHEREDLEQIGNLKLLHALAKYDPTKVLQTPYKVRGYFHTVIFRDFATRVYKEINKRNLSGNRFPLLEEKGEELNCENAEKLVRQTEVSDSVQLALESLSPLARQVMILKHMLDLSVPEISKELGYGTSTSGSI